ncbi:MAG TPA: CCA tRNA nucleotidyltransferase [Falsiroseomonas sp.]|jgi:poly(A) polymerase/tRNA nucleotidyltransferase (CCA-adding enzyme)|nr:CCA tRNA nucleotidyltransferase [Falsiroseomonas sp.]
MTDGGADAPHARIAPPAFLASGAPAAILVTLPGARAVGGCVRDALAGRAVHDVDIAAPLPPEEIARRLLAAGLKVFGTGLAHGTVTAVLDRQPVEVTALRRDVATDGRHAEVAWTTDWRADAARRDFRINAMSLSADGRLWDYFGGREDLAAGRVRFVGDPATRLAEDYLRALRFFRFWARYGRGEPDAAALAAIRGAVPALAARIAPERIWMELKRLLEAPDPAPALELMRASGLLAAVLPEAGGFAPLRLLVARGAPADPLLRLGALLLGAEDAAVHGLVARLRLSGAERGTLVQIVTMSELPTPPPIEEEGALRRFLAIRAGVPPEDVRRQVWLAEARDGQDRSRQRAAMDTTPWPVFPLKGRDLIALGVPPGPAVGRLLGDLHAWWIAQGAAAPHAACLAELRRRLENPGAPPGATDGTAAPGTPAGT